MTALLVFSALTAAAPAAERIGNASAAAAGGWKMMASDPGQLTFSVGVGFSNVKTGYIAGGANGLGPEILKTEDGAESFTALNASFGLNLLLLAAEAAHDTVIVTSVFGELYSRDAGKTWRTSIGGGQSQSVRYIGAIGEGDGLHFGIAGMHNGKQGVGITNNAGISFKSYPVDDLQSLARYAVYPNEKTWYLAAGTFPSAPPPPPPANGAVRRARISELMDADGNWDPNVHKRPIGAGDDGYSAQIAKTTDGGATWKIQFTLNGSFYFNEIDCAPKNPNLCCAAAESAGSAKPGINILCTTDGETWSEKYSQASEPGKHSYTLMGLEFTTATEAWAVGGSIGLFTKPLFLHTTDGGNTWTEVETGEDLAGGIALGLDMISETVGYAAVDNLNKQQAGVAKYSA